MRSYVGLFLFVTFILIGNFEVKASSTPPSQELTLPLSKINVPNIHKNPSFVERIMLKKMEKHITRVTQKKAKREPKGRGNKYGILSITMLIAGLLFVQLGLTFSSPILIFASAAFSIPFIILGIISLVKKEKPIFVGLFPMVAVVGGLIIGRIGSTLLPIFRVLGF